MLTEYLKMQLNMMQFFFQWMKDDTGWYGLHQDALTRMSQDEQVENLMSKIPQGAAREFCRASWHFSSAQSMHLEKLLVRGIDVEDRPVIPFSEDSETILTLKFL